MLRFGIVTHGGVGTPSGWNDGCDRAGKKGFHLLEGGESSLDAVQAATLYLEDDGRYNAGSGSGLRLDGKTMEMDAALMDSAGRIGAVAAIQAIRNPVRVAREVMDTPHMLLAGEGATRFARRRGVADSHPGPGKRARERFEKVRDILGERRFDELRASWRKFDLREHWNFGETYDEIFGHADTVGAVALDREGNLAVANSTGGASPMLAGRVGDSPLPGCGFFAGPAAAVAATGLGEEIIRRMISIRVYDEIQRGSPVGRSCREAVEWFPKEYSLGVIAISRDGFGAANNRDMPWAKCLEEEK